MVDFGLYGIVFVYIEPRTVSTTIDKHSTVLTSSSR